MHTNTTQTSMGAIPVPLHKPAAGRSLSPKKFTPASRHERIKSWKQRMQILFARQSY